MKSEFPDVYNTSISYTFRNYTYEVKASHGDIDVIETDNGGYDAKLDETNALYWVGCLVYWYDMSHPNSWTEEDYLVAAHICRIAGHVLEADELERICGITEQYGVGPSEYVTARQRYNVWKHKVNPLTEGAD